MENLELKELGLVEMNSNELNGANGGFWLALAAGVGILLVFEIAGNPSASVSSFKKGWDAV